MTVMLKAALEYAQKNKWPIFPCRADKTPYTERGVLDATTNTKQIKEWWSKWPTANIGLNCGEADLVVIDLDPGHDLDELFENVPDLRETGMVQQTPRGGEHWFYQIEPDETVAPSSSKLGEHIDVRSFHSYVLLAPSKTRDGDYAWTSRTKAPYVSDTFLRVANAAREKHEDRDTWTIEPDLPENVELAIQSLQGKGKYPCEIAIMGRGGDHKAYATAAMMKSFGISPELASDLMWEHWNPRCDPPWGAEEADHFERKIENAYSYNQNPPGNVTPAYKVATHQSLFTPVAVAVPEGRYETSGKFSIISRRGIDHIPPPSWLVPDVLQTNTYAILFGASQAFKTFVALDIGLSLAVGRSTIYSDHEWPRKLQTGPVLFAVGEGHASIKHRVRAWELEHNEGEYVPDDKFFLANPVPNIGEELETFVEAAKSMSESYKLIVIDTIGRAMQGHNVNSQEDASTFTAMVEALIRTFDCTVLAIHHTGHTDPERELGSSVFAGDADTRILAERIPGTQNTQLKMMKQKDGVPWEGARVIELKEVNLGEDQSSLAAIKPTTQPKTLEEQMQHNRKNRASKKKQQEQITNEVKKQLAMEQKQIIDFMAVEVLRNTPSAYLNNSQLAQAIKQRDERGQRLLEDQSSKNISSRQLPAIRENLQAYKLGKYYDPIKREYSLNFAKDQ